ncbi:nuclear transport factor 2 family protein [Spirillospora sp. NPDC049652]
MTEPSDLNTVFTARFNSGDARAVTDLYEQDAVFHSSSGPVVGRDAIRAHYADMLGSAPTIDSRLRQILTCGDLALLLSDWDFSSGSVTKTGVSIEVARRQPDGTWKYAIDEPDAQR